MRNLSVLVLAVLCLAVPAFAGEPADTDRAAEPAAGPPLDCTSHWLRNPEPYELGDLSALSAWTLYIVADGQDPETLKYGAWGDGEQQPAYLGPGPTNLGASVVELVSKRYIGGENYFVWARTPAGDCALWSVYVPRDHGHGQ